METISQTIKEKLRLSRSRQTSFCSESENGDAPSRCGSLDCILSAKTKKQKSSKLKKRRKSRDQHSSDTEVVVSMRNEATRQTKSSGDVKEEIVNHDTWLDQFSIEERRKVPPVIPNVQNLFYSSTQLRMESWQEIELMNVNKLLSSQANLKFYCYDIYLNRLESSLSTNDMSLYLRNLVKPETLVNAGQELLTIHPAQKLQTFV